MIEVEALRKEFGELVAVDEVSLTASPGEIFGLLGPNGAGKSTTIGCVCGLLKPTRGTVRVLGHDVVRSGVDSRRQLGVVPQDLALYTELSALENLRFWGAAYGLRGAALKERVAEVLETVGLADRATEPVKQFSGGMKRRLNFGCGIVHRPRVLLLDEPTVGVDPQSRVRLLDLVRAQVEAGTCVLYTTHYMEEAESLCDRLAIIDRGRIIAAGTLAELRNRLGQRDVMRFAGQFDVARVRSALERLDTVEIAHVDEESLRLTAEHGSKRLPELLTELRAAGAEVRETTLSQPSLESLFIQLTGEELRE